MRWYWIDRFTEFESGTSAKAIKNVSLAEDHLHDHFPGYPVMPKSLVLEGMAQTGGLLVCEDSQFREKVVLAKVPKVRFHCEARPGDSLVYSAVIGTIGEDGAIVQVTSHKGDQLQAEAELVFAYLNEGYENTILFDPADLIEMMRILRAFDVGHAPDGSPLREPPDLIKTVPS